MKLLLNLKKNNKDNKKYIYMIKIFGNPSDFHF